MMLNEHLDLTNQFPASLSSIRTDPPTSRDLSTNLLFSRVEPGSHKEVSSPKHGDEDDKEHIGGANWFSHCFALLNHIEPL